MTATDTELGFAQLFRQVSPEEICDNIFALAAKDFYVITAGKEARCNSMVGSGGGWGTLFRKPAVWCVLQSTRYTLELMEREGTYTISYFPDAYRRQALFLGSKSGRDSGKMGEVELTSVATPSGDIAFKEARLIFECELTQLTTPLLDDFRAEEARGYIEETYKNPDEIRKYAFGEIVRAWVKRSETP